MLYENTPCSMCYILYTSYFEVYHDLRSISMRVKALTIALICEGKEQWKISATRPRVLQMFQLFSLNVVHWHGLEAVTRTHVVLQSSAKSPPQNWRVIRQYTEGHIVFTKQHPQKKAGLLSSTSTLTRLSQPA